jgi:hypothetical protein
VALIPLNPPATETFVRRTAWNAPAALKYWHLASLDAPTVAATWACAFAWAAHVRLPLWAVALLALVVWSIYLADRLLDARAGLASPGRHSLQERHWFHWRHRRVLAAFAAAAALTAAWMVETRLPASALRRDSLVGLATLAYFSGVHGRGPRWLLGFLERAAELVSREMLVGVIFSAGCVLPVLPIISGASVTRVYLLLAAPAAAFAAVAWLNVKAIRSWETWAARTDLGIWRVGVGLALVCLGSGAALAWTEPRCAALLVAAGISALLLAGLDVLRDRLEAVTLRAAADLVLLTPILLAAAVALSR